MTALHFAAMNNLKEVAMVLVESGATVTNTANEGMAPLHAAACRNSVDTAMFLVEQGADIHGKFMVRVYSTYICIFYIVYCKWYVHRME
jgi:ankyrin repeat protein